MTSQPPPTNAVATAAITNNAPVSPTMMVLFKKTDWKKTESVLAAIPLDPNGGKTKKIPTHVLASDRNRNPRKTVESAKHWHTLDTINPLN